MKRHFTCAVEIEIRFLFICFNFAACLNKQTPEMVVQMRINFLLKTKHTNWTKITKKKKKKYHG